MIYHKERGVRFKCNINSEKDENQEVCFKCKNITEDDINDIKIKKQGKIMS
jgi:hypothetical protein